MNDCFVRVKDKMQSISLPHKPFFVFFCCTFCMAFIPFKMPSCVTFNFAWKRLRINVDKRQYEIILTDPILWRRYCCSSSHLKINSFNILIQRGPEAFICYPSFSLVIPYKRKLRSTRHRLGSDSNSFHNKTLINAEFFQTGKAFRVLQGFQRYTE